MSYQLFINLVCVLINFLYDEHTAARRHSSCYTYYWTKLLNPVLNTWKSVSTTPDSEPVLQVSSGDRSFGGEGWGGLLLKLYGMERLQNSTKTTHLSTAAATISVVDDCWCLGSTLLNALSPGAVQGVRAAPVGLGQVLWTGCHEALGLWGLHLLAEVSVENDRTALALDD